MYSKRLGESPTFETLLCEAASSAVRVTVTGILIMRFQAICSSSISQKFVKHHYDDEKTFRVALSIFLSIVGSISVQKYRPKHYKVRKHNRLMQNVIASLP